MESYTILCCIMVYRINSYIILLLYYITMYHTMLCYIILFYISPSLPINSALFRVLESNFPGDPLSNSTDMRIPTPDNSESA